MVGEQSLARLFFDLCPCVTGFRVERAGVVFQSLSSAVPVPRVLYELQSMLLIEGPYQDQILLTGGHTGGPGFLKTYTIYYTSQYILHPCTSVVFYTTVHILNILHYILDPCFMWSYIPQYIYYILCAGVTKHKGP